jgi:membrane associated rhomboid family serine protease
MAFPASSEQQYDAPRLTPAVLWLIAINVAIYFVQLTLWKDLPQVLGYQTGDWERSPWTIATYMFAHGGFWHLALNMYTLWAFGPRVERAMGTGSFTWFYLWCGLGGLAAHAMFFRNQSLLYGASAAIFGVIVAYARRWPDDEVYFFGVVPMRVRWLVVFMIAVNVVMGALSGTGMDADGGAGTAYIAHLGGVAFGWLYFLFPTAPSVDRLRQRVAAAPDLSDEPPRPVPRSLPRPRERQSEVDEVVEQSKALTVNKPPRPAPVPRPALTAASRREALDLVLDKISEHGLESLTLEERHLLEEMSRKLRNT